jgi:hypothetical protein
VKSLTVTQVMVRGAKALVAKIKNRKQ